MMQEALSVRTCSTLLGRLAIPLVRRPAPWRSCSACTALGAWLPAAQKLQEGAEVSLGPSEVESAEDFFLATSLRHRCVLVTITATAREESHHRVVPVCFSRVLNTVGVSVLKQSRRCAAGVPAAGQQGPCQPPLCEPGASRQRQAPA